MAISFGVSLAIVGLCMTALRGSLVANVIVSPGFLLSFRLIPKSVLPNHCSDAPPLECDASPAWPAWMFFSIVSGVLIDGFLFTWPLLFLLKVLTSMFSKQRTTVQRHDTLEVR